MSGTDHSAALDWQGPGPVMVLVRPQMGENIGAAARGMWNFGLDRLRLVTPRDGWPNERAVAMASGAGRVLDHVIVAEDLPGAIGDLNFVFATTARGRELTKEVFTPESAMVLARKLIADGQSVGVMFGPERSGLENEDVARANASISVPVNPAFGSLNLAQCVLLMGYEWRKSAGVVADAMELGRTRFAERVEVEKLVEHLMLKLDEARFFFPEAKAPGMRENLRNMFGRLPLSDADVKALHGVFRALAREKGQ